MVDASKFADAAGQLRRSLHQCPEIAFQEHKTSKTVERWLREHGVSVQTGVAGTGLLAEVRGRGPGPTRLFRSDLDAIGTTRGPEVTLGETGHREQPGVSAHHACGHDGHCAMLAGALATLAAAPEFDGNVVGLFQPAEETGEGANAVLEHEALAAREFDGAFAIHNQPGLALGRIGIALGVAALASTGLIVRMRGRATHASTPHKGNAAISAMATFICELLALPSHVVPFGSSVLITPTYLDAGRRQFGRVPPLGELGAVVRANSDECLEIVLSQAKKRLDAFAGAYGLEGSMEKVEPFPVTVNDREVVERVREQFEAAGLDVEIREGAQPWSEDFGHILNRWPGALMLLGSGEDHAPLHSENYEFPDELLATGIRLWLSLADWRGA